MKGGASTSEEAPGNSRIRAVFSGSAGNLVEWFDCTYSAAALYFAPIFFPNGDPTAQLLREHPREFLTVLGFSVGGSIIFYVYTTYMQKFLANTAGFSRDEATEISAVSLIAFMIAQPLFGWLSDKVGRKPLMLTAFGGGMLITWPVMTGVAAATTAGSALSLIIAAMMIQSCYTSISAVVKAELFPTTIRTLGVALPYAIALAIGGTTEYVALWFKSIGAESGFYVYASAAAGVSFLVALTMRDTRMHSRITNS